MEATGNDALIPEWQIMETHLQVKSNFEMFGIPQAIDGTTATKTTASNKAGADNRHETEKDDKKSGRDKNQKTTKKFKLNPTISAKITPLLAGGKLSMRNLVRCVGLKNSSGLFPDKKVGVSAALKEKIGFKGCVFPHQDNIVSDVIDETAVSLLDKCIKDPTIADSKGV